MADAMGAVKEGRAGHDGVASSFPFERGGGEDYQGRTREPTSIAGFGML